jgi:hypothetical protein
VSRDGITDVATVLNRKGLATNASGGIALNPRFDIVIDDGTALRINYPLTVRSDATAMRDALGAAV